ncbi:MAG TPA: NifB/NifX family molybdenum-iron cluster-binding protein [Thermotogota bacterium]|nr:NifB/NifX family molybdenum-iron cluster-binding protein [Thermotogota bacterium]
MKIGIPAATNNGLDSIISGHFGKTPFFAFVIVEDNEIKEYEIVRNPFEQHSPGQIPGWVSENGVKLMIVQGIGARAISFFEGYGIKVGKGYGETVREVLNEYFKGTLSEDDLSCNHSHEHHDHHEDHEEGHTCKKDYGNIAITVQENSLNSMIDERFGRGKYLVIIDGDTGAVEITENIVNEEHGVGPAMIATLAEKGVKSVIVKSLGKNATDAAEAAGIRAFFGEDTTGTENLKKLWNGELKQL